MPEKLGRPAWELDPNYTAVKNPDTGEGATATTPAQQTHSQPVPLPVPHSPMAKGEVGAPYDRMHFDFTFDHVAWMSVELAEGSGVPGDVYRFEGWDPAAATWDALDGAGGPNVPVDDALAGDPPGSLLSAEVNVHPKFWRKTVVRLVWA